jgi:hypothetical protein
MSSSEREAVMCFRHESEIPAVTAASGIAGAP